MANKRKQINKPATPMVQKITWVPNVVQRPAIWLIGLVAIIVYGAVVGIKDNDNLSILPINSIEVIGELNGLRLDDIETAISSHINSGFFSVDVNTIKNVAEELPWARSVSVRRVWPDRLQISVTEQNAIARWKDNSIINEFGNVFSPEQENIPDNLARLDGPEGTHLQLLEHYQVMQNILSKNTLQITAMRIDSRRAMHVRLDNGLLLFIGKVRDVHESSSLIARFSQAYKRTLQSKVGEIEHVDLRYTNGFSVQWKQNNNELRAGKNA